MISVPNVGQSLSSLSDTDTLTFANTLLIFYLATLSSLCVTVPRGTCIGGRDVAELHSWSFGKYAM